MALLSSLDDSLLNIPPQIRFVNNFFIIDKANFFAGFLPDGSHPIWVGSLFILALLVRNVNTYSSAFLYDFFAKIDIGASCLRYPYIYYPSNSYILIKNTESIAIPYCSDKEK